MHEIRRRKECEIDIMSGQIKNIDEVIYIFLTLSFNELNIQELMF